jgi:hypothetical protein
MVQLADVHVGDLVLRRRKRVKGNLGVNGSATSTIMNYHVMMVELVTPIQSRAHATPVTVCGL